MTNNYSFLVLVTAFASAVSQVLLNVSSKKKHKGKIYEYLNPWVISSYLILGITLVANIFIMRKVELKIAHAFAAATYLFFTILSRIIFKEKITYKKIIGLVAIICGIVIFVW